ncbi:hypothetical protein NP590_04060 [Methylomonas sp. SURF-2]|uniref:Uncharacterized protein n=1 Tax=Methylomonas subterranea TaxID=2952225 RepID=A0ABT1TCT6_9GAMM|nr:hypothetical protein [Methylomonas sp. SURF-2]MCQ8103272.1 hypothetical protein [Methylomonas sp. SURF-2]
MQDYLEDLQTKHREAFMTPAVTRGCEETLIAYDIYRYISEKYPETACYRQGNALWLAMQMVVGVDKAAELMRQASILPAK